MPHSTLAEPHFLDTMRLDFAVAQPDGRYHVALLVSPWAYGTYWGG